MRRARRDDVSRLERFTAALPAVPLDQEDGPWLGWALLVGLAVAALYAATNDYPAFGAGLYTLTADAIRANGYALPATVPHYGPEGVPFGYPPLLFYVLAVLRDLGGGVFGTTFVLPPLLTVLALVPAYLLGRDTVGDRRAGTAAALLVVLNPPAIQWHISAGGIVRAPALCLALFGCYAALRVFRDGEPEWVPVGLVTVALVALTHPTYALFTVATYLLFWVGYDRSLTGLVRGAAVGFGALALTTPWLLAVVAHHGPELFTGAASTHGGIGGGLYRIRNLGTTWTAWVVAATLPLLATERRVLGVWTVAVWLLFFQRRFAFIVGAIAVVALVATVARRVRDRGLPVGVPSLPLAAPKLLVAALLVCSVAGLGHVGGAYAGADRTTPEFVDDHDVAAMQWAATETPADATFVVLGDAAEWFPVVTDRTMLVSPWGAEWRGSDTYFPHLDAFVRSSRCGTVDCVETQLATVDASPEYVYVPKGGYTVRGRDQWANGTLADDFRHSAGYERRFRNEGVELFHRTNATRTP